MLMSLYGPWSSIRDPRQFDSQLSWHLRGPPSCFLSWLLFFSLFGRCVSFAHWPVPFQLRNPCSDQANTCALLGFGRSLLGPPRDHLFSPPPLSDLLPVDATRCLRRRIVTRSFQLMLLFGTLDASSLSWIPLAPCMMTLPLIFVDARSQINHREPIDVTLLPRSFRRFRCLSWRILINHISSLAGRKNLHETRSHER